MAKEMKTPERLLRVPFCPGCGHGIFVRLMQEVIEEKGLSERYISGSRDNEAEHPEPENQ